MTNQELPQGEEKPPITIEELRRAAEQLKKNVEKARIAKEESLKKKLTEHESLAGQYQSNEEQLREAKKILDYFLQMQEKGEITEPEDLKNLEETKKTAEQLEKQQIEIEKRSRAFYTQPEIQARMQEQAGVEDKERTGKKMYEQIKKELYQEATEIALTIKGLAAQNDSLYGKREKLNLDSGKAEKELKDKIDRAISDRGERSRPFEDIMDNAYESQSAEEFVKFLEEKRKSLAKVDSVKAVLKAVLTFGLLEGKKKKVIDSIKSAKSIIENFYQTRKKVEEDDQEIKKVKERESELKSKYQEMIMKARKADQELKQKFNYSGPAGGLDFDVSLNGLEGELKKMANIKRWEDGKEMGGKYKDWPEARDHEGWIRSLSHEWRKITKNE